MRRPENGFWRAYRAVLALIRWGKNSRGRPLPALAGRAGSGAGNDHSNKETRNRGIRQEAIFTSFSCFRERFITSVPGFLSSWFPNPAFQTRSPASGRGFSPCDRAPAGSASGNRSSARSRGRALGALGRLIASERACGRVSRPSLAAPCPRPRLSTRPR